MMRRVLDQLAFLRGSLPPARGLLPLVLLLVVWQLVQPGPSPYFPAPARWWTATVSLLDREHLVAAFGATTLTFLEGLAIAIVLGTMLGVLVGVRVSPRRAPAVARIHARDPAAGDGPVASLLIGYSEA